MGHGTARKDKMKMAAVSEIVSFAAIFLDITQCSRLRRRLQVKVVLRMQRYWLEHS